MIKDSGYKLRSFHSVQEPDSFAQGVLADQAAGQAG
jgi:hypothetical protein